MIENSETYPNNKFERYETKYEIISFVASTLKMGRIGRRRRKIGFLLGKHRWAWIGPDPSNLPLLQEAFDAMFSRKSWLGLSVLIQEGDDPMRREL